MTSFYKVGGERCRIAARPTRLVMRASPEPGESLWGWAIRLAGANGYDSAYAIKSLVGRASSGAGDRNYSGSYSHLINASPDDFARYFPDRRSAFWNGGELGIPHRYFSPQPKVCPVCLSEKAILKSVWSLKIWRYCPEHSCELISTCPFCAKPLVANRRGATHCGNRLCDANLSECAGGPTAAGVARIVGVLGDVAARRWREQLSGLPRCFRSASLLDIVQLIFILSRPLLRVKNDSRSADVERERLAITEVALSDWPAGYHDYLERVRSTRFANIKYPTSGRSYIEKELPFIYRALLYGRTRISPEILWVFKHELACYAETRMPLALDSRFVITGEPSHWMTLQRAARELGFSRHKAKRAGREGAINIVAAPLLGKTRRFVERNHFKKYTDSRDAQLTEAGYRVAHGILSVRSVKKMLRVTSPTIAALIEAGYIKTLPHRGRSWLCAASIEHLMSRLAEIAIPMKPGWARVEIGQTLCISSAKLTDVIEYALAGKMSLNKKGSARRGLRRFWVVKDDLRRLFPDVSADFYTVEQAAQFVGLSGCSFRAVVRGGLLRFTPSPKNRGRRMFTRNELAAFSRRYVSSAELAAAYCVTKRKIFMALSASSARIDGLGQFRFWLRGHATALLDRKFRRLGSTKSRVVGRRGQK
jgi:hypothetical protein